MMAVVKKRHKLFISSLKLAGFAGSGLKISFNQGPKIVIFSGSYSTFLFDSILPGVKIRMSSRDGGFPKRPELYTSSLKLAGFDGILSENKLYST